MHLNMPSSFNPTQKPNSFTKRDFFFPKAFRTNTSLKKWECTIFIFIYFLSLRELHTPKTNELPLPRKIPNQMIMKMKNEKFGINDQYQWFFQKKNRYLFP
jgi:hypothetical protein